VRPICAVVGAGAFGVDLFFALSAYLITVLLFSEKDLRGTINVSAFYIRRVLRIWPLYFSFIAIAAIVPLWARSQRLEWPYIMGYLLLVGNWVDAWKGLPASITIPLWSISVEEQFYVVWPLIVKRISMAQVKYAIASLLCLGYLSRILLVSAHVTSVAAEYNTFARIDPVAFGIWLALVVREGAVKLTMLGRIALISLCLAICFLVSGYAGLNSPEVAAPVMGTLLGRPLVAIAVTGLLIAFMGAPAEGAKVLAHPVLTYLGRISYGLYVYHLAGLTLGRHVFKTPTVGVGSILGLLTTILFSMASYRWLESPFLRLKDHFAIVRSRPV
jgi:peptidoglycan/LPS O-acetylase OafA/YrhL